MNERWEFIQTFRKSIDTTTYTLKVDNKLYKKLNFPADESYASVIDKCCELVEQDKNFAGEAVSTVYVNVDLNEVILYTVGE